MDNRSRREYKILYAIGTALGILNIVLVFIWTCSYLGGFGWQDDPLHQFNYHPVFAILGLVVLYGKGKYDMFIVFIVIIIFKNKSISYLKRFFFII